MSSESNKIFDPYRFVLNLRHKVYSERGNKYAALSGHNTYYAWNNIRTPCKN